jgi:iron complex outermembrane recepter protein
MSIKQVDRTRVSLAAAISMILAGTQVSAQESSRSELEEVVVTGSFTRGTPEDSAMPVEVVSFEELQVRFQLAQVPSNSGLV